MHEVMPTTFRFTRAMYDRMGELGILWEGDRVELIRGEILTMSPAGPSRSSIMDALVRWFGRRLPDEYVLRVQNPVALSDESEPEPDIAIVRPRPDHYRTQHPVPADILLMIEVADSLLDFDLGAKSHLYATALIPEYWVLDVHTLQTHIQRDPVNGQYHSVAIVERDAEISAATIPGFTLPLRVGFR